MSWSAYQFLVLIVCEDQELIANEVFCHRSCYANYTHLEKLQRIQDATPPATDSATSAAEVQGSSEDAALHQNKDKHQTHPLFDALISFVVESTNAASNVAKKV